MQGRGIVKEFVRIRSELNCMHQYYSILHETSLRKVEVLLHNSNIYICAGEHDDNMIFLHEIDYHHHDNRHIVKSLCLPQSLYQHVFTEFEYQLQLEFVICNESTINYKYPNKF